MNFKKYHVSKNLFDTFDIVGQVPSVTGGALVNYNNGACTNYIDITTGLLSLSIYNTMVVYVFLYDENYTFLGWKNITTEGSITTETITNYQNARYARVRTDNYNTYQSNPYIMLNSGSTALPYEPYSSEVWHDTPHYIHNTSTDTITTLPAVLYPTGTTATVGLKGQMEQSSTPTPTTPIQPSECGERTGNLCGEYLDESTINSSGIVETNSSYNLGLAPVKANTVYSALPNWTTGNCVYGFFKQKPSRGSVTYNGERLVQTPNQPFSFTSPINGWVAIWSRIDTNPKQFMLVEGSTIPTVYEPYGYKIPILNNSQTTNVYLGEVESTRKIKKLVLTGQEDWYEAGAGGIFRITISDYLRQNGNIPVNTHYKGIDVVMGVDYISDKETAFLVSSSGNNYYYIADSTYGLNSFKSYLAAQYAAGTPVTVWYVLATETTGIVNEPLRKIGDYADEVSGITIPTIAGANTISIGTALQPSEVSVNYKGWHPVADVHERENGAWT